MKFHIFLLFLHLGPQQPHTKAANESFIENFYILKADSQKSELFEDIAFLTSDKASTDLQ